MRLSVNETATVALKACRGCQLSEGLAEDAARAVAWASERGLPGLQWLATCFRPKRPASGLAHFRKRTEAGESRMQKCWYTRLAPSTCYSPGPQKSRSKTSQPANSCSALRAEPPQTLESRLNLCGAAWYVTIITNDGIGNQSVLDELAEKSKYTVQLRLLDATPDIASMSRLPSVEIPEILYDDLNTLGARTYVEATDASRRLGAGAGLVDTD